MPKKTAAEGLSPGELFIVIFGPHGKLNTLISTKRDWKAFRSTDEFEQIRKLIETLRSTITLNIPKGVHAALMQEAAAEGVTLDQLCLSKLVAQLRELV